MALSNKEILNEINNNIIIEPLIESQLGSNSYDVTLGPWYYRHDNNYALKYLSTENGSQIAEYWGADCKKPHYGACRAKKVTDEKMETIYGVPLNSEIIILKPGELILCHTNEIVGTKDYYTTSIQSRSTCGRIGLTVCKDASIGSIGYINKWTLEVENHSKWDIVLVVGQRIAQILFWRTGPCSNNYSTIGSYKDTEWNQSCMLPAPAAKYIRDNIEEKSVKKQKMEMLFTEGG